VHPIEATQKSGLPAAGGSNEGGHLVTADIKVHVIDSLEAAIERCDADGLQRD
jgi:hypothetical protein